MQSLHLKNFLNNKENKVHGELQSLLNDVKQKTSLDVTVYDFLGEIVASTGEKPFAYKNIKQNEYDDGIFKDVKGGFTHFLINIRASTQPLHGIISGVGEMSGNYAYMVSSIIESSFRNFNPDLTKSDAIVSVLTGEASISETKLIKSKHDVPDGEYYVFALDVGVENVGEVLNFLNSFSTSENDIALIIQDGVLAYLKYVDFYEEKISQGDFALLLFENIRDELSMDVSICSGNVVSGIEGFRNSYQNAFSGLKLGKYMGYPSKVFSYKEFIVVNLLEELPKSVIENYYTKLLDKKTLAILEDTDMTGTVEVFMNHSLNLSEAARSLYIHRNTLMYRLDKIEKDTGLNVRIFSDAMTFRILEILYKMGKNSK